MIVSIDWMSMIQKVAYAHETFILRAITTWSFGCSSASSKSVVLHVGLEVTSIVYLFNGCLQTDACQKKE